MNAGVDMVYLNVKPQAFRILDVSGFVHRPPALPYGEQPTLWGMSEAGQPLTGNLFVNRGKGGYDASVQIDDKGLHVQFNPSKMQHPFELSSDILRPVDMVKTLIHRLKIDADLDTSTLSRIDLSKQKVMRYPASSYSLAFASIQGKRTKQRIQYPDGYEVGNNSKRVVFYDKTKELDLNGISGMPENLLRCECRFMGKTTIGNTRSGLGIGTLKDLINSDPECLTDRYNTYLRNDIFRIKDNIQLSIDFGTELETLSAFLNSGRRPKQAIQEYLLCIGSIDALLKRYGSIERFKECLTDIGVNRITSYRIGIDLYNTLNRMRMIEKMQKENKSIGNMLSSLIETFAA